MKCNECGELFQVPAFITKIEATANMSLKIRVDTMESLSGDSMHRFFSLIDKPGYFCFASRQIETNEILDLPMPDIGRKKTMSQKLRAELFHNWNVNNMKYDEFEEYYNFFMGHIINKVREKRG
jgi:hypothetical protein